MSEEEEFYAELNRSPFEAPPLFGEFSFAIDVDLVSLQSKKAARDLFKKTIREHTKNYQYLLAGDLSLEITIQTHQKDRYEADSAPDHDNLLKPLLDSLAGPDGIIIDDCQIRSLGITWISWVPESTRIDLRFQCIDSEYVNKQGLIFVQIEGALCLPFDTSLPLSVQRTLLAITRVQFRARKRLSQRGWDYYSSSSVLPVQRRFHRTRLNAFPVKTLEEYKEELRLRREGSF
jgi:Holliday junction resolvase RusA-like endonuclease